jgi:Uncharacterized conserved protein
MGEVNVRNRNASPRTEPAGSFQSAVSRSAAGRNPEPDRPRRVPDQDLRPAPPPRQDAASQGGGARREGHPVRRLDSPEPERKRGERPRTEPPGTAGSPKSKPASEAEPAGNGQKDQKEQNDKGGIKGWFQRPGEISLLRKMLMLVFGLLFVWCVVPMFFHIAGIGVISSSLVMLAIFLTAMFWHLIDRDWTWKKAAVVSLAGVFFAGCVIAFSIVSGLMLGASLTAVPSDCRNYTVVVLGCKAHGDQPSWMLSDRLAKAYSILSDNPDVNCVVTGGRGDDEQYTEAYVMKKYLVDRGISPDRIYTEELSGSTEENLLYSKTVIGLNGLSDNIVIVTDRFHELRARIWAEKSGFSHIYSGCCETRIYLVTGYWFREMFGLARLYVFGI